MDKNNILCIFDMDHTIIDDNTDTMIFEFFTKDEIKNLKKEASTLYSDSWSNYVNFFLKKLKEKGVTSEDIKNKIYSSKITKGMGEVFEFIRSIKKENNVKTIIISGANKNYIKWVVESHKLEDVIDDYFGYESKIEDDALVVNNMHEHDCNSCDSGQCKNKAVKEYVDLMKKQNLHFNTMIFSGDGLNDYCAGLAFNELKSDKSFFFIRKFHDLSYSLIKENGEFNEKYYNLKSKVEFWEDGHELLLLYKKAIN